MFAVVRTGGKQYRVAAGDRIVVEKLAGDAGDSVSLGDVLMAGDGGELKDVAGLTVAAEIVAQAKGDKVIVFKKRRRHNYRRKNGHRQQHTILKILAIGGEQPKAKPAKAEAAPVEASASPAPAEAPTEAVATAPAEAKPARAKKAAAPKDAKPATEGKPAAPRKPAAKKTDA